MNELVTLLDYLTVEIEVAHSQEIAAASRKEYGMAAYWQGVGAGLTQTYTLELCRALGAAQHPAGRKG